MKKFVLIAVVLGLSACSEKPKVIASATCFVDAPANGGKLSTKNPVVVSGWSFDLAGNVPESKLEVQFLSKDRTVSQTFEAPLNVDRPDVAAALNNAKAQKSGFNLSVPANSLKPGVYEISLLQGISDGVIVCKPASTIEITE